MMHRHKLVMTSTSKPCRVCGETTQSNWTCAVMFCKKTKKEKIACRCKRKR